MKISLAFRYQNHEYYTELSDGEEVTFGSHKKDNIKITGSKEHLLLLRLQSGELSAQMQNPLRYGSSSIEFNTIVLLNSSSIYASTLYASRIVGRSSIKLNLPYNGVITFGRKNTNDVILTYPIISGNHFQLLCEAGKVHVEDLNSTNHLYLNGERISKAYMKSGDVLSIYTFRFVLENGVIYFENIGSGVKLSDSLKKSEPKKEFHDNIPKANIQKSVGSSPVSKAAYLEYHLSPRIREQLPTEPIVLSSAPNAMNMPGGRKGNLAFLLSSGAMMAASLATGMISPAALLMRSMSMISPLANMAMFKKMSKEEQKQYEEYEQMRHERYEAYIADQKARIKKVADVQRRILLEENPVPSECISTVTQLRRSLWERMAGDSDFLTTRLGIGKTELCVEVKSRSDVDGFSMDSDELEELAGKIIEETRYVDDSPVRIDLKNTQTVGIIGPRDKVFYQLRSMIVALTTQHSYKDLRLVGMFDRDFMKYWGVLRWLPHIWDESGQVRYISFDEERRHTVSELLSDVIKKRRMDASDNHSVDAPMPLPHFIVIAQSNDLLQESSIYDALVSNDPTIGFTTLILADSIYDLPQTCQYMINLTAQPYVFAREAYDRRSYFKQDAPIHQVELEAFTRRMAAIEMKDRNTIAALPSAITFLQGYRAKTVEDLDILGRWERSEPDKTLAAPIGMMEGGKTFDLNMLDGDTAHGPHGLLAGTTGSGKSELLQTLILSIAVNYHPHDVNFVIIDYKGGGMSDLMEPLPHVVGKITNIDRNIGRSLVALKSEMKRRQRLFAELDGVNNIIKYQRAFREGRAKERLPHLIIVTDEFAEMKKEEPEFMKELNSVATIGRTLGIHMLLATQKPAGVVTDQINANSRFRICMKVQDVADSREMLKRSDAARITQAGRAYVRVGEDEIFELFQSFYSAAEYTGKSQIGMNQENQVRIVGVTGNRINPIKKKKKTNANAIDELTAIIQYMNRLCEEQGIQKMNGPWLPELPKLLYIQDLSIGELFDGTKWPVRRTGLAIPIGMYDIPAMQKQGVQYLDFEELGHIGIYGGVGSGKTAFLKSAIMMLGLYYSPQDVKISIVDGGWSMNEFKGMPHVTDVYMGQNETGIHSFIKQVTQEMEARTRLFQKHSVGSFQAYRESVSQDLPAIVIVVDRIGALNEQYMELEALFMDLAVSGAANGIHLMYTANLLSEVKYKFQQLIKGSIAMQLSDATAYANIVGRTIGISLPNTPGRALLRDNPPVAFQTVLYSDAADDPSRHKDVLMITETMRKVAQAEGLISDTDSVPLSHVSEDSRDTSANIRANVFQTEKLERDCICLGIDEKSQNQVILKFDEEYVLVISSDNEKKRNMILENIRTGFEKHPDNEIILLTKDNWKEYKEYLVNVLNERKKDRNKCKKSEDFNQEQWLSDKKQICIFVENISDFAKNLPEDALKSYRMIFSMATGLGVIAVVSGDMYTLSEEKLDLITEAVVGAQTVLAFGHTPAKHRFFKCDKTDPQADIALMDGKAAFLQHEKIQILRNL